MKYLDPTTVTDGMLTSSIPETDYAEWSVGTTYSLGARVIYGLSHRIWESLTSGNIGNNPTTDPVNWRDVGPTNRWAPFDAAVGTAATATGAITMVLTPSSSVDSVALLDVSCASITVTMTSVSGGGTVYSRTVSMISSGTPTSWYDYYFSPVVARSTLILTDLPPYTDPVITVTISSADGTTGTVSCGTLQIGMQYEFGDTQLGANVGIIDYSKKVTDDFGVTTLTERPYIKWHSADVFVPNGVVDETVRRIAARRAKPTIWIGATEFDSMVVYGFPKDWQISVRYPTASLLNIRIEGLV